MSNSSWLLTAFNALLYATEPLAVEVEQSNPCVFVACMSFPVFFSIAGLAPSKPPWKGTANFH